MPAEHKTCRRCNTDQPAANFAANAKLHDGLNSYCRDCMRTAVKRSRSLYRDRYNAKRRQQARQRSGGSKAIKAVPDAAPYLNALLRDPCAYCGSPASDLDHITPRANGGPDEWDNYAAACRSCNGEKRDLSLIPFLLRRRITNELLHLWAERDALTPSDSPGGGNHHGDIHRPSPQPSIARAGNLQTLGPSLSRAGA